MNRSVIGFDRRLELAWLEEAALLASEQRSLGEARARLLACLTTEEGQPEDTANESARGSRIDTAARMNTAGVLMRLWVRVPAERQGHRSRGLTLWEKTEPASHVAVHWGVALAAYPFFYDVATHVGRLLELQGSVSLAALTRRMQEGWGERSTVKRALQRVIRSMVGWGCLREGSERGIYEAPEVRPAISGELSAFLIESLLRGADREAVPLQDARALWALFPFHVALSVREALQQPGLELHREGGGREMLALR